MADDLTGFDAVVVATELPMKKTDAAKRVAVSEFPAHSNAATPETPDLTHWLREWGVGDPEEIRGGLLAQGLQPATPARNVTLLQRKAERPGKHLENNGLDSPLDVENERRENDRWCKLRRDYRRRVAHFPWRSTRKPKRHSRKYDCSAGQLSERSLADDLISNGSNRMIGGADVAAELDAKRAIDQGVRLALSL